MSMQQALGAVGFVVGAYFGYPQLGFVVGSLVGGALTPAQKVEGPRIEDQKVTVSTEGSGIPRVWGTVRLGGNVIESTDKMEVSTTESQGKGGGGVESTTYRYYVNMRTLLCEARAGSTVAIRKIWQDGKLVYDASTGVSVGSALASAENPAASMIVYQGDEDQLPDPTEEARHGLGNALAYRGVVTLVLNHIECPGGRVPQFSYECSVDAVIADAVTQFVASPLVSNQTSGALIKSDHIWEWSTIDNGFGQPTTLQWSYGVPGSLQQIGQMAIQSGGYTPYPVAGTDASVIAAYPNGDLFVADLQHRTLMSLYKGGPLGAGVLYGRAAFDDSLGRFVVCSYNPLSTFNAPVVVVPSPTGMGMGLPCEAVPGDGHGAVVAMFGGVVYAVVTDGDRPILVRRNRDGEIDAAMPDIPGPEIDFSIRWSAMHVDQTGVFVYAISAGVSTSWIYRVHVDEGTWDLLSTDPGARPVSAFNTVSNSFWCSTTTAIIGPTYSAEPVGYNLVRFKAITPVDVPVAKVIAEECARAGLEVSQFDVSTIGEMVHGYTISNPSSARAGIQPLMSTFAIDATDEDGKIKFFNRADKTAVTVIGYDELGCAEDVSEVSDPMPLTRANITELPRSVMASYINRDFDYQTSTEEARRQVTGASADQNVELAISLSSDQAATAAHRILYDAHNDRNRRTMKLSRRYAYLSAGDVTTVEYPRGTLSDWRWVQSTDTGALLEVEAVPADAELYAQTAVGGTGYTGQEVAPLPPPTRQQLLDIPILRDSDNDAGLYDALAGFGAQDWRGAALYDGPSDSELELVGTVRNAAVIGSTESALGGWARNVVDETNWLTVSVGASELNSTTRDLMLSSNVNACAIGAPGRWEIVQFQRAEFLGAGRYVLSGLRRGMRGTEHARGNHAVGDGFVLLTLAGMLRPMMEEVDIGKVRQYRAISQGRPMSSAPSQPYVNTAEGLRPLSTLNLRAERQQSGDLQLTWDRRTRLSENWMLGLVPLGEASEEYEVDVVVEGVARRTLRATSRSLTYSASQQAQDGSGAATMIVYQMSSVVGRGRGSVLAVSLAPPPDASAGPWPSLPGEASGGYIQPPRWLGVVSSKLQLSAYQVEPVNGWRLYNYDGSNWRQDTTNVRSLPGDSAGIEKTNGSVVDVGTGRYELVDNILRTDSVYVGNPLPVAPSILGVEGTLNIGYAAGYFYRVVAFQGGGLGLVRSTDAQTWTFVVTLPAGVYDHLTNFGYNPFAIYETPGSPLLLTSTAKNGVLRAFWTDLLTFNLFAQVQGNGALHFDGVSSGYSIQDGMGYLFLRSDTDYGIASMVRYTTTSGEVWSGPTDCELPDETRTMTIGTVTTTQRYRFSAANARYDSSLGKWISTNGIGANGSAWWCYTSADGGLSWTSLSVVLTPMVSSIQMLGRFSGQWFISARTQGQRYQTLKSSNLTTWVLA
ncbi:phage tail protein [Variovorax sp. UMC13]|uniref:phage tail protein n=1 Tax=Variovorax sp. UMC13 TaxID=1862326 RepID=UPI001602BF21|nr:phage tail protein [Variovorax sp. UMC13]MBB1599472.1 hypothetical protein [Variovorax sp. UMC13]